MKLALHEVDARHPGRDQAHPTLDRLSLAFAPGESVAIIGPSGAGKTTLLEVLGLARAPARGTLTVDDLDPWRLSRAGRQALRARLILAPQVPPLPPRQRVVTAILAARLPHWSLIRSLRSLWQPCASDVARVRDALLPLDLDDRVFDRVDRLSGGERQRVALARLLVCEADLWLVDEPLSALDPARAQRTLSTLVQAARARGATLVATLHQVDAALTHFPRILGLRNGRLVFDLPAGQVTPELLDELYADEAPVTPVASEQVAGSRLSAHEAEPLPWAGPCR